MPDFLTIPDELIYVANAAFKFFDDNGFDCEVEPKELEYPQRPAAHARNNGETTIVIVESSLDEKTLQRWARCGKAMVEPTKICFTIPEEAVDGQLVLARKLGLSVGTVSLDSDFLVLSPGIDLTINVVLPDLTDESRKLKSLLASSYQKFENGDWRDAYTDACISLEQAAVTHFLSAVQSGRLETLTAKGKVNTPTEEKIRKLSMGQIPHTFSNAKTLNASDQLTIDTLEKINASRVNTVHYRWQDEQDWRRFVSPNMHAIVNCMRKIT